MTRINVEALLEKKVSELQEAESEKKKELGEIQAKLKKNQKALDVVAGDSSNSNKKPKRDD